MSRKGNYNGGSTIVYPGSDWYAKTDPHVDPLTGETRADTVKRIQAEARAAKEKKAKQQERETRKKVRTLPKADSKQEAARKTRAEQRNRDRVREKLRARPDFIGPVFPDEETRNKLEALARKIIEKPKRKRIRAPAENVTSPKPSRKR